MACQNIRGRLLLSACAMSMIAVATSARAEIETVTVSAQRVEQNIQQVPISVTAFTAGDLQAQHVTSTAQLSALTPNVNFDGGAPFSGDSSVLSASIRGIGQDDFAFNTEPGVGVYLDGVYIARTIGANVDLLDVQRVEVLKGPQGTLFGRNTIGGAINIVTRDPGDEFSAQIQVTGGSFNRRDVSGYADIPLAHDLVTSISFASYMRDGYQKVIPYHNVNNYVIEPYGSGGGDDTNDDFGGQDHQAARFKAVYTPTDSFRASLSVDFAHQDQSSIPNTVLAVFNGSSPDPVSNPNLGPPWGLGGFFYNACIAGIPIGRLCDTRRGAGFPEDPGAGLPPIWSYNTGGAPGQGVAGGLIPINPSTTQTGDIDTTYANGPNFAKYDVFGASLILEDRLSEAMTLKSISGYRHIHWNIGIPLDGSPDHGNFLEVVDKQRQQQASEELQVIGNMDEGRLSYVAGLYYFYEDGFVHDWVPFDGMAALSVQDSGLNDLKTSSYAAYFHVDYKVTDHLGVTIGARYSIDHKEFNGGQQDLTGSSYKSLPPDAIFQGATDCYTPDSTALSHGVPVGSPFIHGGGVTTAATTCQEWLGFPVAGQPYRYFPAGWNKRNFYEFTPTVGIQYHVNDDVMLYTSWSKGFKSGGWTTRLSQPIADGRDAEYGPEKAQTYEVGVKSALADHRVILNVAGFYTKYEDIQLNEQVGASPVLSNLGTADIYGVEVESEWDLGRGFLLRANAGFLDARYTDVSPLTAGTVTLDSSLPKTPRWKLNLQPQWTHNFNDGTTLQILGSWTYTSSLFNDSLNTPLLRRPSVNLIDASIHYLFHDGAYEVAVGGTNLLDERYITTGSVNYFAGFVDGTYSPPAQWYVSLSAKF